MGCVGEYARSLDQESLHMVAFIALASGASPTQNLSIFDPASPPAEAIRNLFILVLAVTGAIFLLVEGVLLYSIVRFRRSAPEATEPPQVYGSMPIEIAWTAAPALICFLLALILTRTEFEVRVKPPDPRAGDNSLFVTVIGRQWWWEYVYSRYDGQELGFITANELHVPASEDGVPRPVYLTLQSADVCHSYWVPRLAGKTDLIPGRTNQMWFQSNKTGLYLGQCAEYCGTQHAHMLLRVYVDSPADFQSWLANQRKAAVDSPLDDKAARAGRDVFLSQSCVNCHRVRGTRAQGTYAPDLTHLMSRETLASGMVANTPEELRKWLIDPQQTKPGCLMPAFGLSEQQVNDLVGYLGTLK
jgi:cytochrome c oxidase subunit 2